MFIVIHIVIGKYDGELPIMIVALVTKCIVVEFEIFNDNLFSKPSICCKCICMSQHDLRFKIDSFCFQTCFDVMERHHNPYFLAMPIFCRTISYLQSDLTSGYGSCKTLQKTSHLFFKQYIKIFCIEYAINSSISILQICPKPRTS